MQRLDSLFIITNGKLQMTGDDTLLLVITGGIACQLQDLGCEVLQDSGEVDYGS